MHSDLLTASALLQQSGPGAESASAMEFVSALVLLAVFGAIVAIGYSRLKYTRLSEQHTNWKREARQQWFKSTPATVFYRDDESESLIRDELEEGLAAARDGRVESAQPDGTVTLRAATTDAWRDLRADLERRFDNIPPIVPALGLLAALVFVLGTAAVYTEAIVTTITDADGSTPDVLALPLALWDLTMSVLGMIGGLFGLLPYGDFLVAVVVLTVMVGGTFLYEHYYVVALGLTAAMTAIVVLDRRVPHEDVYTKLYYHRRDVVWKTSGVLAAVWLAGVVPAVTGRALGSTSVGSFLRLETVGNVAAVVFSLLVAGYFAVHAVRKFRKRLAHAATIDWADGPDRLLGAYLVARYAAVSLATLAVPLVVVFLAVLLFDGRLFAIFGAIFGAPWPVQAAIVLAIGGSLLIGGYEARQRWPELARSVRKSLASQSVRLLIFRKAITAIAMVVGATLSWAMVGIEVAIWAGLLSGVLVYVLYSASLRARYRADMLDLSFPTSRTSVARCGYLNIDGYDQFVVDIGGEKYVRSDLEDCAREAAAVAVAGVDPNADQPATVAEHYGEALFKYGYADPDDRDTKLDEMVRKAGLKRPRNEHRLELKSLREDLTDEFPEDRAEERIQEFQNLELLYPCGDGYVEYRPENDPWRQGRRSA